MRQGTGEHKEQKPANKEVKRVSNVIGLIRLDHSWK